MGGTLIQARQLLPALSAFDYRGKALDIRIGRGEIVALIGPDYCGKSDWLRTLVGVRPRASGQLSLPAGKPDDFNAADWSATRRQLAYVHSDNAILSAANALQNVMLPAHYHRIARHATIRAEATQLLAELGVYDLLSLPAALRRDQRYRIAIARALILRPDALVLDNPFTALDRAAAENFQQYLLRRVSQHDMALLLVTHDIHFAIAHADQIVFITGEAIQTFNRQRRIEHCEHAAVRHFLDRHRIPC